MIRRRADDHFLLITQNDHAAFAGFLAEHIGNKQFESLGPDVIEAIGAHDAGWPLHDEHPTLNADGSTLHVFETPISLAVQIWSASAERAERLGLYGALLVSLHQLALSDIARQHQDFKVHERANSARDLFMLNKFQHAQIERQEMLRRKLGMRTDLPLHLGLAEPGATADEDRLRFHFRMLTLCDRISLQLCCGALLFPRIENVYARPGALPSTLGTYVGRRTWEIEPWPFDLERIEWQVPSRQIPVRLFQSLEEFQGAFEASAINVTNFEITSAEQ
jgi:hypothetical protein